MQNHTSFSGPTWAEIHQQPDTWKATLALVGQHPATARLASQMANAIIAGAGSSAYAASAVEQGWRGARAIPTTDLITEPAARLPDPAVVLSLARSGNSPESVAAVERMQQFRPDAAQFAITCNAEGSLARQLGANAIVLDPRTNDRGLAMTSSFSNLVLAGLCVSHPAELQSAVGAIADHVTTHLSALSQFAAELARDLPARVVVLASATLVPWAREAALKMLELTGGRIAVLTETFVGLRHGPMSFVDRDTLVLALLSSDARIRLYEQDVLSELRAKQIGKLAGILADDVDPAIVNVAIPATAGALPDWLRTPFEIVFAQLLAYHLSRRAGFDPDNPSPTGVISRVVQGVRIHAG